MFFVSKKKYDQKCRQWSQEIDLCSTLRAENQALRSRISDSNFTESIRKSEMDLAKEKVTAAKMETSKWKERYVELLEKYSNLLDEKVKATEETMH